MKSPFSIPSARSRVEAAALLAIVALLCVLAVVQHRWLGAIAEAERRKLGEEAKEKAAAIAQDVDRELTRAFLELRIDAKTVEKKDGVSFSERFERWRADSPHAGLVKSVFVAERSTSGPSRLFRFDPSTRAFVEEAWPESLARVKEVVDSGADNPLPLPISLSLPPVMADVPALLSPVIDVVIDERQEPPPPKRPSSKPPSPRVTQFRQLFMSHSGRGPVEIVLLDPVYLKEQVVGGLASLRLGPDGPFVWSAVRSSDETPIAGTVAPPNATSDARAPLLRLRFDELDKSLLRGVLPGLAEATSDTSVRFMVQLGSPAGTIHASGTAAPTAPWTLLLRHREGSIDAAVLAQRRRNTALSASILGVLGLSAGLVFFSARRLRAIASQQVEFVAAVSHELRTPLAVIRSAADNLADGVVQDQDQTKRYGALIRNESVRLTDMVEHVLEFAGADSPGRASRGPIDAGEAARHAVSALEALAVERGARVRVETSGEGLRVNGDLSHLTRAISNLLGNALKYGGEAPVVTVLVRRAADGVEISVADHGSGLAPSEIPRLFEPFYRGQRASEAQIPGSGLGLALVKRIVESHGGRVHAGNGADGGALFTIALPAV